MLQVPRNIQVAFDRKIQKALVRREECPDYRNWLRFLSLAAASAKACLKGRNCGSWPKSLSSSISCRDPQVSFAAVYRGNNSPDLAREPDNIISMELCFHGCVKLIV